jgi:hypothetical protein
MSRADAKPDSSIRTPGEQVRHEQRVHDEAGAVLGVDDGLAELVLGDVLHALHRLGAGEQRRHHLDEGEHRHRVEEVQPDDLLGTAGGGAELHDRDGRGVGRQHRVVAHDDLVQAAEQLGLDGLVLARRLDDELGVGERVEVGADLDAAEHLVADGLVELAVRTARPSEVSMRARPRSAAASSTSWTRTVRPARASTSAMPEPIRPQPTTATAGRDGAVMRSSWWAVSGRRYPGAPVR